MTIVAVSMRTESGDDYLSLFTDIKDTQDFVNHVEDNMGEELAYVYSHSVCSDGDSQIFKQALQQRIEELQDRGRF
jgi:hypothetical protein